MSKLSITAYLLGLVLSFVMFGAVRAQTTTTAPTAMPTTTPVVPTSAPSTGHVAN